MPEQIIKERARKLLRQGKQPTTAAGEFVREEIEHVRHGKHGARNTKQAIAIGLSKARRAGVPLKPPAKGETSERTRRSAESAYEVGQGKRSPRPSRRRSLAMTGALKRERRQGVVSRKALSTQAKQASAKRTRRKRSGARRR